MFIRYLNKTRDGPVFAISHDLGKIAATSQPVVWTLGFTRDPAVQLIDLENHTQDRSLLYKAYYDDDIALVRVMYFTAYKHFLRQLLGE
jgi:hypothetical protein